MLKLNLLRPRYRQAKIVLNEDFVMKQVALTNEEIEKYTGVPGLDGAKLGRSVFGIVNAIRVGISMSGGVGVGGPGHL